MSSVRVFTNLQAATMVAGAGPFGLIADAAVIVRDGQVDWVGPRADCPDADGAEVVDCGGRLMTPGLIDCHTHIVHGGDRAREFEMRQAGASYEEIARAGGGIASTVAATRAASAGALLAAALTRVDALIAEGVTTVEIKSGYGLDRETELRMLDVAREIGRRRPIAVRTTFLGAHAVPKGTTAADYLEDVCLPTLAEAHAAGLVDAVDGFLESIAFGPEDIRRVFDAARALGLPVKLHADQLSHGGGAALAAEYGALSADHLEYTGLSDARAMAAAGTVAVLLPGAFYTLHETQVPPIAAFRAAGVPMAVATDLNPGSSPLGSLLLAMNMAATLFGLTTEEALAGTTRNAAAALGLSDRGRIAPGCRADLALWDAERPAELSYRIGVNPLYRRFFGGEP